MFAIAGMLGGAAAVKLLNRKHGVPQDIRELQEQKNELQRMVQSLQKETQDEKADKELLRATQSELEAKKSQLDEVLQQVEELQTHVEQLSVDNTKFKEQNQELTGGLQALSLENEVLARQAQTLTAEKTLLSKEIDSLKAELHELRDRVSDVMNDLLAHKLSDREGADALLTLGCTIHYVEPEQVPSAAPDAAPPEAPHDTSSIAAAAPAGLPWSQPSLLLENRERLERLVVSSMMMHKLEAGSHGQGSRVPVVTFPMNSLLANKLEGAKPAPGTPSANKSSQGATPSLEGSTKDVPNTERDQRAAPAAPSVAASHGPSKAPAICMGTPSKSASSKGSTKGSGAMQFVYSLQGSKGHNWVAKVPVEEDSPPPFFNTPGLVGKQLEDAGSPSNLTTEICVPGRA